MRHRFGSDKKGDPNKVVVSSIDIELSSLPLLHALSSTEQFPTDFLQLIFRVTISVRAASDCRLESFPIAEPAEEKKIQGFNLSLLHFHYLNFPEKY